LQNRHGRWCRIVELVEAGPAGCRSEFGLSEPPETVSTPAGVGFRPVKPAPSDWQPICRSDGGSEKHDATLQALRR
jgi:hypothetical protein